MGFTNYLSRNPHLNPPNQCERRIIRSKQNKRIYIYTTERREKAQNFNQSDHSKRYAQII